jgi:hypothetical protein
LFVVLLPLLHWTKSDFLDLPGEATPTLRDKIDKLAKSPETTVERNSLRGHNPQVVSVSQLLRKRSGVQ